MASKLSPKTQSQTKTFLCSGPKSGEGPWRRGKKWDKMGLDKMRKKKKEKMGIEGQENDKGKNYFPGDYKLWVGIQTGLQ